MPLVAWSAIAYASGLLAGFVLAERDALVVTGFVIVAALVAQRKGHRWAAAALVVAAGAVLIAQAEASHERACAGVLGARKRWELRVDAPAAAGGVARGTLSADGCMRRATVLVAEGQGAPGEVLLVTGQPSVDERAVLVQNGGLTVLGPDAAMARLRARTGARIDRLFGGDAPMVRALVIADMGAIDADQRNRYANAGLVHMLSVSGLHVGIIALALQLLGATLRLPIVPTRIATLVLLVAYVVGIGAPPPAVRAAVMLGVLVATRLRQRPTNAWAILALGGIVPLVVDPRIVLDLGWQLSVAGAAALISGGALAGRIVPATWRGMRRKLASGAVVSIVATLVTAPLVAWAFGRISLVGPATNLLADPVMGLLQPVLFLALCIPIGPVERLCADAAHALIVSFDAVARIGAAVPHGAPAVAP